LSSRATFGYDHGYDGEVFYLGLALDYRYVEGWVEECLERIGEDDLRGGKSKVDLRAPRIKLLSSRLGRSNQRCRRISLPANPTEPETYTIDDTIRVPVTLRDEEGVAHVRAIFRRMRQTGNLGPRGLDPVVTGEVRSRLP
jgi:hypothetical protein